jgi:DNA-binding transcriptional LysR family regulator
VGLELRELRYFTVLCEELHFGRAAERLHISQSPLSQSIAQLERKLGTRLLDRSSRHVQLTPAGEVLLQHARRLLRDVEDAIGATKRAAAGETGLLRIAVGLVARDTVLAPFRHELDERFPDLAVETEECQGDRVVDKVLHGAADIGLMLCPPIRDEIGEKALRRDNAVAIVHRDHPLAGRDRVTLDALAKHTLLLTPRTDARGTHDVVLALFHEHAPSATRIAQLYSGAFWEAMRAGSFTVVAASAPFSGDCVALAIDGPEDVFTLSMVWSRETPPPTLSGLVDAADAAIAANGWL